MQVLFFLSFFCINFKLYFHNFYAGIVYNGILDGLEANYVGEQESLTAAVDVKQLRKLFTMLFVFISSNNNNDIFEIIQNLYQELQDLFHDIYFIPNWQKSGKR